MSDTYYTPQHTGDSYIFHKICAPRHYWAYIETLNERWVNTDDPYFGEYIELDGEVSNPNPTFKDFCALKWELHYRDLEHIAFYSQQECNDSLPFVLWKHFWRDCDTYRWRHLPPNKFNDFFEIEDA